jgi:hypothetical protein
VLKFAHFTSLVLFVIAYLSLSGCTLAVAPPPPDAIAGGVVRVNADIDTILIITGWVDGK